MGPRGGTPRDRTIGTDYILDRTPPVIDKQQCAWVMSNGMKCGTHANLSGYCPTHKKRMDQMKKEGGQQQ